MSSEQTAIPRRDTAQIRREIAEERERLDDDLTELERDLLSSAPFVAAALVIGVGAVVFAKSRGRRKPIPIRLTINFD